MSHTCMEMETPVGRRPAPTPRGGVHAIGAVVAELLALYPLDAVERPETPLPEASRPGGDRRHEPLAPAAVAEV